MKKPLKRKNRKKRELNRKDFLIMAAFVVVFGWFFLTLFSQQFNIADIRRQRAQYEEEIAAKKEQYEILEEKAKHSSSDDFYEEKARDEGYIREDETQFVVGN